MKKFYVIIHVIKHDLDPNINVNYRRKIGPISFFGRGGVHFGGMQRFADKRIWGSKITKNCHFLKMDGP